MSLLSAYEQRTAWKYEPICGRFHTDEGLNRKVLADGRFAHFPGSTAVFRPEPSCIRMIRLMREILFRALGETGMLADPLPESEIHMTLHDLVFPESGEAASGEAFASAVTDSTVRAAEIAEEIRREHGGKTVRMAADRTVQMVSQSLVLMLRPQTEQDYELLLDMYRRFDSIRELPYPLTPHITLAYFRPGMLDGDALNAAVRTLQIRPDNAPVFTFSPKGLTAQVFEDMRTYRDVPVRICFCCDGGLNRSVLAANILTHLARSRGLALTAEARAAYPGTQGRAVPEQVWQTLESHGILGDRTYAEARPLTGVELPYFTAFGCITAGARSTMSLLGLPEGKMNPVSGYFYGVRDPEYGEVSYEQAFTELYERAEKYLKAEWPREKHAAG